MNDRPGFLITGASGVIGGGLLERLKLDPLRQGTRFVAAQRRPVEGLENIRLDLAEVNQVRAFASGPLAELGPWIGAALVAGVNHDAGLFHLSEDEWDRVINVNLRSCFLLLEALLKGKNLVLPGSSFLLISSQVGFRGNAGQAAYAAAKGALKDLLEYFSPFFGSLGARLNILFPPLVESPLMANLSPQMKQRLYSDRLLEDPEPLKTCVDSAAFLLSKQASYIHGTCWHADSRISGLPWPA